MSGTDKDLAHDEEALTRGERVTEAIRSLSMRTILEALIVAGLLWTGRSLLELQTQTAVVQVQLATLNASLSDLPSLRTTTTTQQAQLIQLYSEMKSNADDIRELQKLRGFK